ncbi:MAG: hypothetical protein V1854_02645 [Methanobacteriota archaeon]
MAEQQNQVKRKLNVHRLVTFILLFIAMTLGAILTGLLPPDPVGLLVGLAFVGFVIFIGYLADKSGVARYLGWDK